MDNEKAAAREKAYQQAYDDVMTKAPQDLDDYRYLFTRGWNEGYSAGLAREWRKVEDGLPDSDGWYWWTTKGQKVEKLRWVIEVDGSTWLASSIPLYELIAWMPLPEPFVQEEK